MILFSVDMVLAPMRRNKKNLVPVATMALLIIASLSVVVAIATFHLISWQDISSGVNFLPISMTPSYVTHENNRSIEDSFNHVVVLKYVVVIDAGSTGSRVYVYQYGHCSSSGPIRGIKEIANKRVYPALSAFATNSSELDAYLGSMVQFARLYIPDAVVSSTPLSLKATAGLRALRQQEQKLIIKHARSYLSTTNFMFDYAQTKVLSGEEEALYIYLAIQVSLATSPFYNTNIVVADLGSSSKQLAFRHHEPTERSVDSEFCRANWQLKTAEDESEKTPSFLSAKSVAGGGLIAAMDTVMTTDVRPSDYCVHKEGMDSTSCSIVDVNQANFDSLNIIPRNHPCYSNSKYPMEGRYETNNYQYWFGGPGDFDLCLESIRRVLSPIMGSAMPSQCIRDRWTQNVLVGVDNFAKVLEMLPSSIDNQCSELTSSSTVECRIESESSQSFSTVSPQQIASVGQQVCRMDWRDWHERFPVDTTPHYRTQRACFGAAYVYFLLVDVYGISVEDADTFLPLDVFDGFELSWAIGAASASVFGDTAVSI